MIPYIVVTPLHVGPLTIQPFGLLVAVGVMIGMTLATRRARSLGLDVREFQSFVTWTLVVGFVLAHVLDSVLYHPREVLERPWLLLKLWDGLGSFSGFFGGILGALAWKHYRMVEPGVPSAVLKIPRFERRVAPARILPMADVVLAVFPVAWIFGRAGCTVVHDHPGARTASRALLSVAYGPGPMTDFGLFALRYGDSPRYDLGLLEFLFAIVLAAVFAMTWRWGGAKGWYVVATSLVYAPVRFGLDFLRASELDGGDPRYALLTPAQWACLGLFLFGLIMAWHVSSPRRVRKPWTALKKVPDHLTP